jgi:hypothetical protein
VTLGVADGAQVGIAADGLEAGTTIAIGVRTTGPPSAAAAPTTSPLVPSAPRRPGAGR